MPDTPPYLALVGGNEFRRECDVMDRELLALLGGPNPFALILPTAATNENPYVAGENGMRHFRRLGATSDKLLITDADSANNFALVNHLDAARLIYFTGGDPVHLLESLRGSLAWERIQTLHRAGALLAGSSAGAMVMGGQMWRFDGWTPGLGLVPHWAVLPHHASLARRWDAAHMQAALPAGVSLLGIDEATALLVPLDTTTGLGQATGRVIGIGQVTLYTAEGPKEFGPGEIIGN